MSKEGNVMFWGDEYTRDINMATQRRGVQMNQRLITNKDGSRPLALRGEAAPTFEFRVVAGAALKSR